MELNSNVLKTELSRIKEPVDFSRSDLDVQGDMINILAEAISAYIEPLVEAFNGHVHPVTIISPGVETLSGKPVETADSGDTK